MRKSKRRGKVNGLVWGSLTSGLCIRLYSLQGVFDIHLVGMVMQISGSRFRAVRGT